jgi:hypothetical protein
MSRTGVMSEITSEEFWAILHAPVESKPIFYRLYYDNDGFLIYYSMEELPHNYIEIDAVTYNQRLSNIRVIDKKIVITNPASYVKKLIPCTAGTPCDPNDICIVVSESTSHTKWSIKTYETN